MRERRWCATVTIAAANGNRSALKANGEMTVKASFTIEKLTPQMHTMSNIARWARRASRLPPKSEWIRWVVIGGARSRSMCVPASTRRPIA